jgi:hypothetical protein
LEVEEVLMEDLRNLEVLGVANKFHSRKILEYSKGVAMGLQLRNHILEEEVIKEEAIS